MALVTLDLPPIYYYKDYLIHRDINVIKTTIDDILKKGEVPTVVLMSSVQTGIMLFSIPQAFILMKILQTLDFYIYIDCKHPPNFTAFLRLITSTPINFIPNLFEPLVDMHKPARQVRFSEYGLEVSIFANLGQIFSAIAPAALIKALLVITSRYFKKA